MTQSGQSYRFATRLDSNNPMALAALHQEVIDQLAVRLPTWRFIKSTRTFVQLHNHCKWHLHIAFVNHRDDFDLVADVAVEHFHAKKQLSILGAELGNIARTGQRRWTVGSDASASDAVNGLLMLFKEVGIPFMQRFSDLGEVVRVLRTDPITTRLIFPLVSDPLGEANRIESGVSSTSAMGR